MNFNEEKKACRNCIHCKHPNKPKYLDCTIRSPSRKRVRPGDSCGEWKSIEEHKIANKDW